MAATRTRTKCPNQSSSSRVTTTAAQCRRSGTSSTPTAERRAPCHCRVRWGLHRSSNRTRTHNTGTRCPAYVTREDGQTRKSIVYNPRGLHQAEEPLLPAAGALQVLRQALEHLRVVHGGELKHFVGVRAELQQNEANQLCPKNAERKTDGPEVSCGKSSNDAQRRRTVVTARRSVLPSRCFRTETLRGVSCTLLSHKNRG